MRVRGFQTYITNQKLVNTDSLDKLKGMKIGVDAVYWLRTLSNLKDPLADAIGGVPPGLYHVLDGTLAKWKEADMSMLFVTQGMQPPSHMLFSSQLYQQMYEGWRAVAAQDYTAAQYHFALATSRINSDFIFVVAHYLQGKGCEIFQAPYFAASQLTYFAQEGMIDAVFGPPVLLLFGIPMVIVGIDFHKKKFEWIDLNQLLTSWNITKDQLIDACLLAGTEYCLTFPYLSLPQLCGGSQQFHFATTIDFIRQAPLIGYIQHFSNDDMRRDHVEGYCICKALIRYPLAMYLDGVVRLVQDKPIALLNENDERITSDMPLPDVMTNASVNNTSPSQSLVAVPDDFQEVVGYRLPNSLYYLIACRFLNRKLPLVLASGEWWDRSHPTVDTMEYRDLFSEVQGYRLRALGLIASRLPYFFRTRPIRFSKRIPGAKIETGVPDCRPGTPWNFTLEKLLEEMQRQRVTKCSFKFCLTWHAHEASLGRQLFSTPSTDPITGEQLDGPQVDISDIQVLEATVYFMVLENLGYFTSNGGVTVFGSAVASALPEFDEDVLCALELMKFGDLTGDLLESPADRPFPREVTPLKRPENRPFQKNILLISRVVSLTPLHIDTSELWLAPVDFDLAAFHSTVRLLKKTFRHLSEACLCNLLLKNIKVAGEIPPSKLALDSCLFPTFMMPRNCMGIIFKHFLEFKCDNFKRNPGSHKGHTRHLGPSMSTDRLVKRFHRLNVELSMHYRCSKDPMGELFRGLRFWFETVRVIRVLSQNIDVNVLKADMEEAHEFLLQRIAETGLYLHQGFKAKCFSEIRSKLTKYILNLPLQPSLTERGPQQGTEKDHVVTPFSSTKQPEVKTNSVAASSSSSIDHKENGPTTTAIPT